jgi:hypothetical protein
MAKRKKKPSSVRHTRSNQLARASKQPSPPPDEVTSARIEEIVHPATLAQISHYHQLGLRERTLTLPQMVALVLSMVWRQFSSVSEALRVWHQEELLWASPIQVSQQALSQRLRTLPAELFEHIFHDILPAMHERWLSRERSLPLEVKWALQHYERVWAVDGSTLDALIRRVGLLRDLPEHPLAGRLMAILDVGSRLPQQVWYTDDVHAHDQRFWPEILAEIPPRTLLLFDLGFTNFKRYAHLIGQDVTFITRAKSNLSYQLSQVLQQTTHVHDYLIVVQTDQQDLTLRLIEVCYQGKWYRYLTNELDPQRLPLLYVVALYWQRWSIEDAFKVVKRLLALAYFWVGSENGVTLQVWATWLMYAILVDLADDVADALGVPFAEISLEMVYRSLYFCASAMHRGQASDPVSHLVANAKLFGLIKRRRKPPPFTRLKLTIPHNP